MKKLCALFLALLLCFGVACAEDDLGLGSDDFARVEVPDVEEKDPNRSGGTTADIVSISGNDYSITTPEGLLIHYTVPGNGVYCLTQDIVSQYGMYTLLYNSPVAVAAKFIEMGVHFNIYDVASNSDIYVSVAATPWASTFPNVAELGDMEADLVLELLTEYSFDDVVESSRGTVGGNTYFYFDCGDMVCLITSVNGYEVDIMFNTSGHDATLATLALLDNLSVTTV